eukprot:TRINITY_DN39233_c0_g1_i1.p1 TRINITY_DN39233_c0_g1~~TRINITY_DN39233_c0_g1_i1.p1  ORF type:complete len:321 (+),score=56.85 TRINITY_DN39233_c0_g1_i1:162-1124(+)
MDTALVAAMGTGASALRNSLPPGTRAAAVAEAMTEPLLEPLTQAQRQRLSAARRPHLNRATEMLLPQRALARLLGLLHSMPPERLEELELPQMSGLVQQLRRRLLLAMLCILLAVLVGVWLLVQGLAIYVASENLDCQGPLKAWLMGFLMLELVSPICLSPFVLLLLLQAWCMGALVLIRRPSKCQQIYDFLVEASALQMLQALLLLLVTVAVVTAYWLLSQHLSHRGTDPEIVQRIPVVPGREVPDDEECIICLSRGEEVGMPWRRLACGHQFHQPCVLEWLQKSTRCPVCRLCLHQVAREEALAAVPVVGEARGEERT